MPRSARLAWHPITHDLVTNTLHLHRSKHLPLKDVCALAGDVAMDAECLVAVAVDAARSRGEEWSEIAAAAGCSEASARAKWGGSKVARLLSARRPAHVRIDWDPATVSAEVAHPPRQGGRTTVPPAEPRGLGSALRTLYRTARTSLARVSAATGLSGPTVAALLGDRTVASWPEVYALAHALGGDPEDLRHLWDCAAGSRAAPEANEESARLAAALRGALLAAGSPQLTNVCPPEIEPTVIQAALRGRDVPPWSVLHVLLAGLGADPGSFEPLWLAARVAHLSEREGGLRP
ncbi:helix-turn-helix transcriptional regulator [Streptomyces sp. NPDC047014]|uniref:helix-turn-helix domain-containing protein n=1 Tax=Streptomyces sp. NPDC047014 TaxID=3155736 RepID=UPI00340916C8